MKNMCIFITDIMVRSAICRVRVILWFQTCIYRVFDDTGNNNFAAHCCQYLPPDNITLTGITKILYFILLITSNIQRVRSMISIPGSLLCQVGDDVIRPCKICGGYQIRVPRSIHSFRCSMAIQSRLQFVLGV